MHQRDKLDLPLLEWLTSQATGKIQDKVLLRTLLLVPFLIFLWLLHKCSTCDLFVLTAKKYMVFAQLALHAVHLLID